MRFLRLAVFGACSLLATGCATRPGSEVLRTVAERAEGAHLVSIGVVTTRERADARRNDFTFERSGVPNYAEFTVSIPPNHRAGRIEWPRAGIDPRETFAVAEQAVVSRHDFFDRLVAADGPPMDVTIFVHGYNYNFPEALFRTAQLAADAQERGAAVVFAWPSQGEVAAYVGDRDSAAFSRDALADTLSELARDRRIGRITLFAHSMGGWLAMESVRQLRLQGSDDVVERLQVVLAAPDIDLDLFERQLNVVGPLSPPLTVLTSADDGALFVSGRLSGDRARVGALDVHDPRVAGLAREQGIVVVDISQISSTDALNHGRFVALASMASEFEGSNDIRQAGAFVFNTVGAAISSPFTLVGGALAGE